MFEAKSTTVPITKLMVKAAYRKVRSNQGGAGIDRESLEAFASDELNNLYRLWRRLSSGSYFPQPVRHVSIPKRNGSKRVLGIPTVGDRIAQEVIRSYLSPRLEAVFDSSSYGYRSGKSAHDAVAAVRKHVWRHAWVIDLDICSFFDEVDHELLIKALDRHVPEEWVKLYIRRWLACGVQETEEEKAVSGKGVPQGGVISPLLSNLFLHYVLDKWLRLHYPQVSFVRYADDIIIHCNIESEVKCVLASVEDRLRECKLRVNTEKTGLVYCQSGRRIRKDYRKRFDFLGFTFKPKSLYSNGVFLGYDCAISHSSQKRIVSKWKDDGWYRQSDQTLQDIAARVNPQMRGIIRYYGVYGKWALKGLVHHFNFRLVKWVLNKYKKFRRSYKKGYQWIDLIRQQYPGMFYHWTVLES